MPCAQPPLFLLCCRCPLLWTLVSIDLSGEKKTISEIRYTKVWKWCWTTWCRFSTQREGCLQNLHHLVQHLIKSPKCSIPVVYPTLTDAIWFADPARPACTCFASISCRHRAYDASPHPCLAKSSAKTGGVFFPMVLVT